ncbi:argininosuccinate synthase [Photinus pyralis]|uniref:Argininosuccinate synthase n=1 Tax=Photinus pyralis TaxID=7054 RepID=A0A1Y1L1P6_PHOPY|nr:argininosuccinate synthase [Photinus pyralis]
MKRERVILAYSGGLDTSCILKWLLEKDYEVICYIADVGQDEDFGAAKTKALNIGASDVIIDDLKVTFVEDYIFPAIQAGLLYEARYLLGTSLARPCISTGLMKCYSQHNAQYISHGATGKGNDQVRFELSCYSMCPSLKVIAPWRDPEFTSKFQGRKDLLEFAARNKIPVSATPSAPWSTDANLMHISYESGILENPSNEAPADLYTITSNVEETPDEPCILQISFKNGLPTSVTFKNNQRIENSLEMYMKLNGIGGIHGVGRIDIVENRFIGLKSRGIYESPAAHIMHVAHQDLEIFCLDKEIYRIKQSLSDKLSESVYNGFWFSPEADYLRKCISISQEMVSGTVKLKVYKGNVFVLGRYSEVSLYNEDLVSMDRHSDFTPSDATGFINIHAIRLKEYFRYKKQRSIKENVSVNCEILN